MEMLRESRSREKADGVDRDACIVDRQQFFNTQVTRSAHDSKVILRNNTPPVMDTEIPSSVSPTGQAAPTQ